MLTFEGIRTKVEAGGRITDEEALFLFEKPSLLDVGRLADHVNRKKNGDLVFYNVNRHVNPTNICAMSCKFCAYSRKPGEEGGYEYSIDEIVEKVDAAAKQGAREIHMVGGLHPRWRLSHYINILTSVKARFPDIHLKAFTAVEIDWLARRSRISIPELLQTLKDAGLDSMPGGGAEIFHQDVRDAITAKLSTDEWIDIHRTAHRLGMHSNCTMLYGHVEKLWHRVDHMSHLRKLQDETGKFNAFIPLSFQPHNNEMGISRYTFGADDLRTIAVARIYLDNFQHIKAYWIMLGQDIAQAALNFGANDVDGTVTEEKISNMAGSRAGMAMNREDIENLILRTGHNVCERDTVYNQVGPVHRTSRNTYGPRQSADAWATRLLAPGQANRELYLEIAATLPFHSLSELAGRLTTSGHLPSQKQLTPGATISAAEIANGTAINRVESAAAKVQSLKTLTDMPLKIVIDLGKNSPDVKIDELGPLLDFIKQCRTLQTDANIAVLGLKQVAELSAHTKMNLGEALDTLQRAGVGEVGASPFESATALTQQDELDLIQQCATRAMRYIAGVEINVDQQSKMTNWPDFVDRLLFLKGHGAIDGLTALAIEPARESDVTIAEYLEAVAMARVVMADALEIVAPITSLPVLRRRATDRGVWDSAAIKVAALPLAVGADSLGPIDVNSIDLEEISLAQGGVGGGQ